MTSPRRLRRHQALALDALDHAWVAGRRRAWVELPPGAGKTLVGLETARRLLAGEDGRPRVDKVVVLGPNTAIQGQWVDQGRAHPLGRFLDLGTDRSLHSTVTALTYQSVAVFDPEAEAPDAARAVAAAPLTARLHENGAALVARLQVAGPILLVLDECHHLLEVWGQLLGELLEQLPDAVVLGLTATPPETLTADQSRLVAELFGDVVFDASIPAVVREGDLAPFAELAWLTVPSGVESDWLASEASRFSELVEQLTDPTFGSTPFLSWLDARFLAREAPWSELVRREPELCAAALRMHHAGLLRLPAGAVPAEEHRRDPSADDWVLLVGDWLTTGLARTGDPGDDAVVEAVRRALPAVGYVWTRRGIRRGRSPVDRVLARSTAKTTATVAIVSTEHRNLGERMRLLVLCDHERASAMLPVDLRGVIDREAGSAHAVLAALVHDHATAPLRPLLVTGRTVAGAPETLTAVRDVAVARAPEHARLAVAPLDPPVEGLGALVGPWTSRDWVQVVTGFFEAGHSQVLVGTRGLLGEGWDARRITGLVDLTAVTTSTAVVQTRGRALRIDPDWPEKVALTWSVVCVSDRHPKGGNDWDRLVRKHDGYFGVDGRGDVVDGVAHLDPAFSAFGAPPADRFDAVNARMVVRSEAREAIRAAWRVGEPYVDEVARTVRITPRRPVSVGGGVLPVVAAARPDHLELVGPRPPWRARTWAASLLLCGLLATGAATLAIPGLALALLAGPLVLVARAAEVAPYGRRVLADATEPPSVRRVASAVADALHAAGRLPVGAASVAVEIEPAASSGAPGAVEYRCRVDDVSEAESDLFATALDEAMGPVVAPRYVVPRWVVTTPVTRRTRVRAAYGRLRADGEVWHPVPAVLGANAGLAAHYSRAWKRWVGGGTAVWTGSPEGAGVLAAQQGSDPFDAVTVMRRHWG